MFHQCTSLEPKYVQIWFLTCWLSWLYSPAPKAWVVQWLFTHDGSCKSFYIYDIYIYNLKRLYRYIFKYSPGVDPSENIHGTEAAAHILDGEKLRPEGGSRKCVSDVTDGSPAFKVQVFIPDGCHKSPSKIRSWRAADSLIAPNQIQYSSQGVWTIEVSELVQLTQMVGMPPNSCIESFWIKSFWCLTSLLHGVIISKWPEVLIWQCERWTSNQQSI